MDGDEPVTGRWNYDAENRERPPKDGRNHWPAPLTTPLDDVDRAVLADLPDTVWGAPPDGVWATSRAEALRRLDHFVDELLPRFGPHEDAMLTASWHLAHSLLAAYLNIGLLHPREVCDRVEAAYRAGLVAIASAEGFIRQVIGWREYVWGLYWLWGPEYAASNALGAHRPLPPAFAGAPTAMRCLATTLGTLHDHGWVHHIERLMLVCNFCLLAGINPAEVADWFLSFYVDAYDWVVLPNVIGMGLNADGGKTATKPYIASANYINKMSDYCGACRYQPKQRTGADACPFNFLYWNFLLTHEKTLRANPRLGPSVLGLKHLDEAERVAVKQQAAEFLRALPYYPPEDSK